MPSNALAECANSPLGFQYCHPNFASDGGIYSDNGDLSLDDLVVQFQLAVGGAGTAISLLGIIVLATVGGVASTYLWRNQATALAYTLASTLLLGFVVVAIIAPELVIPAIIYANILHIVVMLVYSAVYCVIPFVLSERLVNLLPHAQNYL
jgi:hypothetical protein